MRFEPTYELVAHLVWFAWFSGFARNVALMPVTGRSRFRLAKFAELALRKPRAKETVLCPLPVGRGRDDSRSASSVP